jgi:hypothetical protein
MVSNQHEVGFQMAEVNISFRHILTLLRGIDSTKAVGPDSIPGRILKELAWQLCPFFVSLFKTIINKGVVPNDWKKAYVIPIYKSGDRSNPSNYRPVSLTCIASKIFEKVLYDAIYSHLGKNDLLTNRQHGFRKGFSCDTQVVSFIHDLASSMDKKIETDVVFLDFQKAFDKVPHKQLLMKLGMFGVHDDVITVLRSFLLGRKQQVLIDGDLSDPLPVLSGVPQGSVIGPLLFLIYINDLIEHISSKGGLFADDTVLYREIHGPLDVCILQDDLDKIAQWCNTWNMTLNIKKCVSMSVSRLKNTHKPRFYTLNDHTLSKVDKFRYLGVIIDEELKIDDHIAQVVTKSNQAMGFTRRHTRGCSEQTKLKCYTTFVRPHLDYACAAWDPHLARHVHSLEMIQRRAVRFVSNKYDRDISVSNIINMLNLEPLDERRRRLRLNLFYKIDRGLTGMCVPVELRRKNVQRRTDNGYAYCTVFARTNPFYSSFFVRTVRDWNALPANEVSATSFTKFCSYAK